MIIENPKSTENPANFQMKRLFGLKKSEISNDYKIVIEWLENFLAKHHPKLGREGHVCPFIFNAIKANTIWIGNIDETLDEEKISELLFSYIQFFRSLPKTNSKEDLLNCLLLTFPTGEIEKTIELIESIQRKMKPHFVGQGLMIGEFYETNTKPGLHNENFYPLKSPIPILAIRSIVESDLLFLTRKTDHPKLRIQFISSYLKVLSGKLSFSKLNEAKGALREATEELNLLK